MISEIDSKLEKVSEIRKIASDTCFITLEKTLKLGGQISELQFKKWWLEDLNKSTVIAKGGGWYDPPPEGFGILFGSENNLGRINYPSLRPSKYWPKNDIYFQKDGLGYLFASPYALLDGAPIIGDFGFTFYLGKTSKIKNHYRKSYTVILKLIDNIKLGMDFKELYRISENFIEQNDLKNYMLGITDKAVVDLGHTIPFIDRDPNPKEQVEINSASREKIHNLISQSRIFSNAKEDYVISSNCAFTYEPRLISAKDESLPMFSFHTIVQFVNGKKIILSNMENILQLLNMEWIFD